jgi:integrase
MNRPGNTSPVRGSCHDLRHACASWHVQNETPLFTLQELGGWESPEMVRRDAHLSAEYLAPYADRLRALRAVEGPADGTFTAQLVGEKRLA